MDLKIDPEFAGKIPPLTDEEYRQLEENILADGRVINPLITWDGVIVDGHNRYRIIQEHPEITYDTYEKDFPDRFAVIAWICKNQLGRRNLTPEQRKYLIGKRYEAEKSHEAFHGNQYSSAGQKSADTMDGGMSALNEDDRAAESGGGTICHHQNGMKTSERIAKEVGTGERYVRLAEEFARGVDAAEEAVPGMKQEILSGKLKGTGQAIRAIGKAEPGQREELARRLQNSPCAPEEEKRKDSSADGYGYGAIARASDMDGGAHEGDADEFPVGTTRRTKAEELQAIQEISDDMLTSDGRGTAEDMLYELRDALDTMIDRWDLCLETYEETYRKKKYYRQVQTLAGEGITYLNKKRKEPDHESR